jgi:hypothetical protein
MRKAIHRHEYVVSEACRHGRRIVGIVGDLEFPLKIIQPVECHNHFEVLKAFLNLRT